MSSEVPVEVAADSSATAEAPANEGEGTADAGEVELAPWTVEAVTRPVVSWADASEEVLASVLSSGLEHPAEAEQSQGLSGEVEEEIIQPTSEVPVADDFSAEVAGENAATDRVAGEITFLKFLDWKSAPITIQDFANRKKINSHLVHLLLG